MNLNNSVYGPKIEIGQKNLLIVVMLFILWFADDLGIRNVYENHKKTRKNKKKVEAK